jgi:PrcB C-terminal
MRRRVLATACSFLLLAALLAASLSCGKKQETGREISFSDLGRGTFTYYSLEETGAQNTPPFFKVVVDQAGWEAFWAQMYPPSYIQEPPTPPQVDLASDVVIAAFQGVKPTGGYSFEVTSIREDGGVVNVYVDMVEPLPGNMVSQAFTSPYDIVKVSRDDLGLTGEVEFSFWDNAGQHLAVEHVNL